MLRQDDTLGAWPSYYPGDPTSFDLNQAGGIDKYSKKMGAGVGISWFHEIVLSGLLVAEDTADSSKGILRDVSSDILTIQLAFVDDLYVIALAYTNSDNGNADGSAYANDYSSVGLSASYKFSHHPKILPSSISAGIWWKSPKNTDDSSNIVDGNTWTLGVMWNDAFREGNNLGFVIGTAETNRDDSRYDDPFAWVVFYKVAINASIKLTPAVFIFEKDSADDVSGVLVKTTFSF